MSGLLIAIGVAGKPATPAGEGRIFDYADVVAPARVTLSLSSTAGVTTFYWEIVAQPYGASAVLSDPTAASPTFTPTAGVVGTYIVRCEVNGGEAFGTNGLAFRTEDHDLRIIAPGENKEFGTWGWADAVREIIEAIEAIPPGMVYTGGGGIGVAGSVISAKPWDIEYLSVDTPVTTAHQGKTLVTMSAGPPGNRILTLPAGASSEGLWVRVMQGTRKLEIHTTGADSLSATGYGFFSQSLAPSKASNVTGAYIELACSGGVWFAGGGVGAWADTVDDTKRVVFDGNITDHDYPVEGDLDIVVLDTHQQLANSGISTGDLLRAAYSAYPFVVKALNMVSDAIQAGSPPTAGTGEAWVVNNWGGGYTDGDVVVYDGRDWNVVGALTDMERLRVVVNGRNLATLVLGTTFYSYDRQVVEYVDGNWEPIVDQQLPGFMASQVLVVMDPVYGQNEGQLYNYAWQSGGVSNVWVPSSYPTFPAIFYDKRPPGTDGGAAQAVSWMARMLNYEYSNRIPCRAHLEWFSLKRVDLDHDLVFDGDVRASFSEGRFLSIRSSTGNDKEGTTPTDTEPYIIDTVAYDAGDDETTVSVIEVLADGTDDGEVYTGRIVLFDGMFEIKVTSDVCNTGGAACRLAERTDFTYADGAVDVDGSNVSQQGSSACTDTAGIAGHSHLTFPVQTVGNEPQYWEVQQYVEKSNNGNVTALGKAATTGGEEHYCCVEILLVGESKYHLPGGGQS